jgi:hypothetical protein
MCVSFWSLSRWSTGRVPKCSIRYVLGQEEDPQHNAPCPCENLSKILLEREVMNLPRSLETCASSTIAMNDESVIDLLRLNTGTALSASCSRVSLGLDQNARER